ncbi:MAG: Ni/Fe-hydrogenase, b-type cytochrome subunit [Deltaproteobacteria bacterium]|nr:Ni/Fe-hydrogenase, b-type cytochrome subunit [Deltaproteobacteria bacterium]
MLRLRMQKEWWLSIRLLHWSVVLSVFTLLISGFYIASPLSHTAGATADKYWTGNLRTLHSGVGVFLTFLMIWRAYLGLFAKFHARWSDLLAWTNIHNLIVQIKFYLLLTQEKPKHQYQYGPLQSLAYSGLIVLQAMIILTGMILLGANYHAGLTLWLAGLLRPLEIALGGLAGVRLLHHIISWGFILFIMIHVYMAIWIDVVYKEGTISSMISGRVFRKIE